MTEKSESVDFKKIFIGLGVGLAILAILVFAGYRYSQKTGGKLVLPGGETYIGGKSDADSPASPPTAPQRFTAGPEVPWTKFKGSVFNYSFSYPETLKLGVFPDDSSDSVAIQYGNIPPERNLLLNLEDVAAREPAYVGKPEEYVRNWHRFFSGLKGIKSVDKFTNTQGLTGYRAIYINTLDQTPNTDVFFVIPGDDNHLIHIANGLLDPEIFDRLIDSLAYETNSGESASAKQETAAE